MTPDGRAVVAPLPEGIDGHFGPALRRFVLAQYHQGQVTVPRLVAMLEAIGVEVSKRQVVRLLIDCRDCFRDEAARTRRQPSLTSSSAWVLLRLPLRPPSGGGWTFETFGPSTVDIGQCWLRSANISLRGGPGTNRSRTQNAAVIRSFKRTNRSPGR